MKHDGTRPPSTRTGFPDDHVVNGTTREALHPRVSITEGIERGEAALAEGRTVRYVDATERLSRWLT